MSPVPASAPFRMKLYRSRPLAVALALAAAAVVFGADTTPKKKPAAAAAAPAAAPEAKPKPAPAANAGEVVATVDGEDIKRGEVDNVIREVLAAQGATPEALSPAEKDDATRQVLDNLVMEHIMKKATAGIKVTDEDVTGEITKIKEANKLTDEQFNAKLQGAGRNLDDLKKNIRQALTQRRWFEEQSKGKALDATEAEAKDFYDKNGREFENPEMLRASHILFSLAPDATPDKVEEVAKKAQAAADRAQKEDFAKLAAELTEEPGGKERGGDLDFFTRQQMVPEFSDAAFKLKTGEVTKAPVRSKFGYHIIKATDHKDAAKQPFESVKKEVTEFLSREKRQKLANDMVSDLKSKAKVEIKLPPPPKAPAPAPDAAPAPGAAPAAGSPPKPAAEAVTPPVSAPPAKPAKK